MRAKGGDLLCSLHLCGKRQSLLTYPFIQRLVFFGNFYLFVCLLTFSPNTVSKKTFFLIWTI